MAKEEGSRARTWWEGVKGEFRKIIWPSQDDLVKQTTVVTVVSIILGIIIAILDYLIQHGIDWLISL
jgi:preprotein translocase subunit SecE